jgi:hypothetical protein
VLAGVAVLALALVVATGLWKPWKGKAASEVEAPGPETVAPPEVRSPGRVTGPASPSLAPMDLEALQEFIKKYPSAARPPADSETQPPAVEPKPARPPEKRRPGPIKPPTTFFNIPAERAPDKQPSPPAEPAPANP